MPKYLPPCDPGDPLDWYSVNAMELSKSCLARGRYEVRAITIIDNALIEIIDGYFRSRSKYRWPLLFSARCDDGALAFVSA